MGRQKIPTLPAEPKTFYRETGRDAARPVIDDHTTQVALTIVRNRGQPHIGLLVIEAAAADPVAKRKRDDPIDDDAEENGRRLRAE